MTNEKTPVEYAEELIANPYAFPGGYPKFAVTDDGQVMCKDCCETEMEAIKEATRFDGWNIELLTINFEDNNLHCDYCCGLIDSAY